MQRVLGTLAVLAGAALFPASAMGGVAGFDRERLEIHDFHIFDLGVADHDDDGDLDLFTSNHLARSSLLSNDGTGNFAERLYQAGLGQTRQFPGWEDKEKFEIAGPGLYLAPRNGLLLRLARDRRATGSVDLLFRPQIGIVGNVRVTIERRRSPGPDRWRVAFAMRGNSRLRVSPPRKAQPYTVHVHAPFPLDRVFVGSQERNPNDRRFQLYQRDRHGLAFADVGGSPDTDAFLVRGGLRGTIRDLVGAIQDELLFGDAGRFRPAPPADSVRKGRCRGRIAGAADVTGDGRLDLFSTCEGIRPKVYRRTSGGRFRQARALGRAGVVAENLRFLPLDADPQLELVVVQERRFEVFEDGPGGWRLAQVVAGRHSMSRRAQIAAADADSDGDLDLYVASATGSTLLRNQGGRLRARDPADAGLPARARAAAWGDADNDGDQDLAAFPGGLRLQGTGFSFTGGGTFDTVERAKEARIAWPDLDGDGDRDPVISARRSLRGFKTYVFDNQAAGGHWLEVDLRGKAQNGQAIGARVRVEAGGRTQTQWVGQNETSLYSQGHYRLYFGLGEATTAQVEVRWPSGRDRKLGTVAADQRLEPVE